MDFVKVFTFYRVDSLMLPGLICDISTGIPLLARMQAIRSNCSSALSKVETAAQAFLRSLLVQHF